MPNHNVLNDDYPRDDIPSGRPDPPEVITPDKPIEIELEINQEGEQ